MQLRKTRLVGSICLKCREPSLEDQTGTIKITFWAEFSFMVEDRLTYVLKNIYVSLCVGCGSYERVHLIQ